VTLILLFAVALTLPTLLIALLRHRRTASRGERVPGFASYVLRSHASLFLIHLFVSAPATLGVVGASLVQTRGDERSWLGPRIDAQGRWLLRTREELLEEKLEAEARQGGTPDPAQAAKLAEREALDLAAATRAVRFTASDGVKLRGFLVPPAGGATEATNGGSATAPRFTALLVHGLYRSGFELENVGAMLRELGGEVLLVELRNHGPGPKLGGSDRARATFGRDERLDVLAAAEFLRARPEAAGKPTILFAVSLGTAAAALAAPEIPDLAGVIFDAPIDDLRATAERMLVGGPGRGFALPQPFRFVTLWSAEHLGRVPFDEVRPRFALKRLRPDLPVLFISAGHDVRCPPDAVLSLFDSLPTRPDRKELWLVPDAEHGKVWYARPDEYRRHLADFVERVVAKY
jgi:pimeloyl-ACP methyl ester carboxylesterase